MESNKRNIGFDIARTISMVYVIGIFHLSQYLGDNYYLNNTILGNCFVSSSLGVFSFISGYFISLKYVFHNWGDVWSYLKKRFLRFYPLFLIASIALWLIKFNSFAATLCGLAGVGGLVPAEWKPRTLWYISMLIIFYLITPSIIGDKIRFRIMAFWTVIFLSYKLFFNIESTFIYNLIFYFAGIIVARQYKMGFYNFVSNKNWLFCGLLTYLLLAIVTKYHYSSFLYYFISFLGIYVILSVSFCIEKRVNDGCLKHGIEFISYTSMSFYLFHRLFYYFAINILHTNSTYMLLMFLLLVAFPIGLFLSYIIQKAYDSCLKVILTK